MSSKEWNERISISPMSDMSNREFRSITISPDSSLCHHTSVLPYSAIHTSTNTIITTTNNNNKSNSNSINISNSINSTNITNVKSHSNVKDDTRRVLLIGSRVVGFQNKHKACCFGLILDTSRNEGDMNVNTNINKTNEQKQNSVNNNNNNNNCQRVHSTTNTNNNITNTITNSLSWGTVLMLTDHIHLYDVLCSSSASSFLFRPHSTHSTKEPSSLLLLLLSTSSSSSDVVIPTTTNNNTNTIDIAPWEYLMSALLLQTELMCDIETRRILSWESQCCMENTITAVRTWTQLLLDGFLRWVPPSTGVRLLFSKKNSNNNNYYYDNSNNNNNNNIGDKCGEIRVSLLGVDNVQFVQEHWANLRRYWSKIDVSAYYSLRDDSVSGRWDMQGELYRTIAIFHKHCLPVLQQFTDSNSNSNIHEENEKERRRRKVNCMKSNTKQWCIKNSMRLTYAMAIVAHIEIYLQESSSSSSSEEKSSNSNNNTHIINGIPFTTAEQNHLIEILAFLLIPHGKTVCEEGRREALHWIKTHLSTQEAHHMLFSGSSKLLFIDFLASFAHWLILQIVPNLLRCVNEVLSRRLCSYASSCSGCNDENHYSDAYTPSRALRLRFQREMKDDDKRSAGYSHKTTNKRNLLEDISLTDWIKWLQKHREKQQEEEEQESEYQSVSKHEKHRNEGNRNKTDKEERTKQGHHTFFFSLSPAGEKLLSILNSLELFNTNITNNITTSINTKEVLSDKTFDSQQTALTVSRWTLGCSEEEVLSLQHTFKHLSLNTREVKQIPLQLFTLAEFISHYRTIVDAPRMERVIFSSHYNKMKDNVINKFSPLPPLFQISLTHFNHFSPVNQAKLICSAVGLNYTAYVSSKEEKEQFLYKQEEDENKENENKEEEERLEWQKQEEESTIKCDEVGMYGSEVMMTKMTRAKKNKHHHYSSSSSTTAKEKEETKSIVSSYSYYSSSSSLYSAITVVEDCGLLKIYDHIATEQLERARKAASLQLYNCGIIILQTFLRSRWSWRWNMLPLRRRAHRKFILIIQTTLRAQQSLLLLQKRLVKQKERKIMWCEEHRRREVMMHEHLIQGRWEESGITGKTMAIDDNNHNGGTNKMSHNDNNNNNNNNNNGNEKNNTECRYDIHEMSHSTIAAVSPITRLIDMPHTAVAKAREMFSLIPSVETSNKITTFKPNNTLAETLFTMELKGRCLVASMEAKKRRFICISLEERERERYLLQEYRERRVLIQQAIEQQQQATVKASQQQWRKRQMQQKQRLLLLQKEKEQQQKEQQKEQAVVVGKKLMKPQTHSITSSSSSSSVKRSISVPRGTRTPKDKQEKGNSNDVVIVIDVNEDDDEDDNNYHENKNEKKLLFPSQNQEQLRTICESSRLPQSIVVSAKTVGEKGKKGIRTTSLTTNTTNTRGSCSTPQMALCKHEYEDRTFIELSQHYRRQLLRHSATLSHLNVIEMQKRRLLFLTAVLERQELLFRWRNIILPYTVITETLYGDFIAVMVVLQDAPRRRGANAMRAMLRLRNRQVNTTTSITSRSHHDVSQQQEEKKKEKKENSFISGKKKEKEKEITAMRRGEVLQKPNIHLPTGRNIPLRAFCENDGVMKEVKEEIQRGRKIRTSSSSTTTRTIVGRKGMVNSKKEETSRSSSRRSVVSWADPPSSL